jgi:hypothetical protein
LSRAKTDKPCPPYDFTRRPIGKIIYRRWHQHLKSGHSLPIAAHRKEQENVLIGGAGYLEEGLREDGYKGEEAGEGYGRGYGIVRRRKSGHGEPGQNGLETRLTGTCPAPWAESFTFGYNIACSEHEKHAPGVMPPAEGQDLEISHRSLTSSKKNLMRLRLSS